MGLLTGLRSSISRAVSSMFTDDEPKRIGIYGPPNAGKCLSADETILLADGTHRRIEDIFESVATTDPPDVSDTTGENWLECTGISVPALGPDLSVEATPVSHVFRQEYDGLLYRVETRLGREVTASPSHPFVVEADTGVSKTPAEQLEVGTAVAVVSSFSPEPARRVQLASDGGTAVCQPTTDALTASDRIPESLLTDEDSAVAATLRELFDREADLSSQSVILADTDREPLVRISSLLSRFDIVATLREHAHAGETHELVITGSEQLDQFRRSVGFTDEKKATELDALIDSSCETTQFTHANSPGTDIVWDEVVAIEKVEYEGYIYDLTVPERHTFTTADGVVVHNTTLANRIVRDWTEHGDAVGPESHVPHETRRARRKENVEIERDGGTVTIDVVDTPGVTTKVDYTEFLEHDMEKDDAVRRSREATEGVAEAMHWLREDVDGVIYVLDSAQDPFTQVNTMLIGIIESQNLPVLILANKIDLEESSVQRIRNAFPQHETIPLSALEGDNMDEVYDKIAEYFG